MRAHLARLDRIRVATAALCLVALSDGAGATILTFDDLGDCCLAGAEYQESGYTFSIWGSEGGPAGWHVGDGTGIAETLNWHGTPGGFNSSLTLTLTKDGGGLFDLIALDIDVIPGSALVVSAPIYAEQTFHLAARDQALNFLGVSEVVFRHIPSYQFSPPPDAMAGGVGIDNVRMGPAPIPEPGFLSLLAVGLLGLSLTRRTRTTI